MALSIERPGPVVLCTLVLMYGLIAIVSTEIGALEVPSYLMPGGVAGPPCLQGS